jgi:polysaccharide export outer membrane protein
MPRVTTVNRTVVALALSAAWAVPALAWAQAQPAAQKPPAAAAPAAPAPAQPAQKAPAQPTAKPATPPAPQPAAKTTAPAPQPAAKTAAGTPPASPQGVTPPPDYVIGPNDVLAIVFWREKDLSLDNVVVRPDGKITLPIINEIHAAGLTPEQLRATVETAASRYVEEASATVIIRAINSRLVYVTGNVNKPGPYPLGGPTTVLQMLSLAGGFSDFAKKNDVVVMRTEGGKTQSFKFQYKEIVKGKNLQQNILLKPGDTIVVP